jgi:hypothetical protein
MTTTTGPPCVHENANTIPKWIKEIFTSEFNLENEKAIHERHNFRLTTKFQAVGNICTLNISFIHLGIVFAFSMYMSTSSVLA